MTLTLILTALALLAALPLAVLTVTAVARRDDRRSGLRITTTYGQDVRAAFPFGGNR